MLDYYQFSEHHIAAYSKLAENTSVSNTIVSTIFFQIHKAHIYPRQARLAQDSFSPLPAYCWT